MHVHGPGMMPRRPGLPRRPLRGGFRCALVLVVTAAAGLAAQRPSGDALTGVWRDWAWEASASDVSQSGATQADMKALVTRLQELRERLKATPVIAQPVGFNASLQGHFDGVRTRPGSANARTMPLGARLWFGAFPHQFDASGQPNGRFGETELMPIAVNELPDGQAADAWPSADSGVVLLPPARPDVAGLPRFGDVLVVKKNPRPIFVPVTTDEVLQLLATQRKKAITEHEKAAERIRKSLAEWLDAARVAERATRNQAQAAKQKDPDTYLAQQARSEKQTEDALRKQVDTEANPQANTYWVADLSVAAAIGNALAGMTPAQRAAPACYLEQRGRATGADPTTYIVSTTTGGCRPVVRKNPDYFDPKLPRSAMQIITVGAISRCLDNPPAAGATRKWGCPTNVALIQGADWVAVAALLDR